MFVVSLLFSSLQLLLEEARETKYKYYARVIQRAQRKHIAVCKFVKMSAEGKAVLFKWVKETPHLVCSATTKGYAKASASAVIPAGSMWLWLAQNGGFSFRFP